MCACAAVQLSCSVSASAEAAAELCSGWHRGRVGCRCYARSVRLTFVLIGSATHTRCFPGPGCDLRAPSLQRCPAERYTLSRAVWLAATDCARMERPHGGLCNHFSRCTKRVSITADGCAPLACMHTAHGCPQQSAMRCVSVCVVIQRQPRDTFTWLMVCNHSSSNQATTLSAHPHFKLADSLAVHISTGASSLLAWPLSSLVCAPLPSPHSMLSFLLEVIAAPETPVALCPPCHPEDVPTTWSDVFLSLLKSMVSMVVIVFPLYAAPLTHPAPLLTASSSAPSPRRSSTSLRALCAGAGIRRSRRGRATG